MSRICHKDGVVSQSLVRALHVTFGRVIIVGSTARCDLAGHRAACSQSRARKVEQKKNLPTAHPRFSGHFS